MAGIDTDFMFIASALHASGGRQCPRFPEQDVAAATSGCRVREALFWTNVIGRKSLRMLR